MDQAEAPRKVYIVNVNVEFEMAVLATSLENAEEVAEDNFAEELENYPRLGEFSPRVMDKCSKKFQHVLPWGLADDDPRRNWTCDQWLAPKKED